MGPHNRRVKQDQYKSRVVMHSCNSYIQPQISNALGALM